MYHSKTLNGQTSNRATSCKLNSYFISFSYISGSWWLKKFEFSNSQQLTKENPNFPVQNRHRDAESQWKIASRFARVYGGWGARPCCAAFSDQYVGGIVLHYGCCCDICSPLFPRGSTIVHMIQYHIILLHNYISLIMIKLFILFILTLYISQVTWFRCVGNNSTEKYRVRTSYWTFPAGPGSIAWSDLAKWVPKAEMKARHG